MYRLLLMSTIRTFYTAVVLIGHVSVEGERPERALLEMETIAALPPSIRMLLRRAVAEIPRVLHVIRYRIRAPELIADVLGDDVLTSRFELGGSRLGRALLFRMSPNATSAIRRWPCASRSTPASPVRSDSWKALHQGPREDRLRRRRLALGQSLDDCAHQRVHDCLQPDRLSRELLGDDG